MRDDTRALLDAHPGDRYVALWALLRDDPDAHLAMAAEAAAEPLVDAGAWVAPLQGVALQALFPRDPERWAARFEEVALASPGAWAFEAMEGVDFERVRALLEALATSPLPHVAHAALARLLAVAWEGRAHWALRALRDPSRDVQVIALEAAARFTDEEAAFVAALLGDPSADARLVAVEALSAVASDAARLALQQRLPHERSARVRRAILETPGVTAQGEGPEAPAAEGPVAALAARAEATVAALAKPVAPWFPERPALHWEDGAAAPAAVGEYILFCQHARSGLEVDERAVEAAALLDRASLAQWAEAMLAAWVARRADVKHHWCLALGAALGGDRVVPLLAREVEAWHRGGRRGLAAHAAQLLAYMGGDRAARALDDVARAHAFDALGALASSALQAEAGARGLSRDDLSDAVVPRWGLAADGAGWLDYGRRRFRVRLEPSRAHVLEPTLAEAGGRALAAPPRPSRGDDPARAAASLERWKDLRHELPHVLASEARRLESAMCSGRAWPLPLWRAHVLGHPLLRVLASRLVWSAGAPGQRNPRLVRPSGDALVGPHGEPVHAGDSWAVALAHPVSLDETEKARWRGALEGEGPQPFPQLARAAFAAGDPGATSWSPAEGRSLAAPSDRARSRQHAWARAGWEPAPLEGGLCRAFLRRYGDVEAVLAVEGIALWSEAARETRVEALRFRRAQGGDWLALGSVAPAVVSEAARAAVHAIDGGPDPDRAAEAFLGPRKPARRRGG